MDNERNDKEPISFEDMPNLLEWVLGKPEPKDEFDDIIHKNYGVRTWRWNLEDSLPK